MATMLDTQLDAHMPDYPIDIDMHQPAEPWFDTEAKMEDDATLDTHFTDHDSTLSVEVDMEDHYAEYEMGDGEGEGTYEEMSSDLLDIEVYDASEPPEDATIPLAEPVDPPDGHPFDIDPPAEAKSLILPLAPTHAMSPLPSLDAELPDALASEPVEADPVEIVDEGSVDGENALVVHPPELPVELATPLPAEDDENVEATHESAGEELVEVDDAPLPEEHQSSEPAVSESRDVEGSVVDPHEISEGVYIDPPPAVLVSFEAPDCPDVCLFNQPVRSRSPTPSTEDHGQGYQVFTLLLHQRPILYYEPLASVFEALRQEEYLTAVPQFADSELVLDAYDLQLVISEDNIYAREVTLHDLNVLHDGSDIAGPLRLRLKSVMPRFILRYHLLQDQVARLNLAPASDEHEPQAESTGPSQQDQARSDLSKQNNQEPQPQDAQEETDENALPTPANANVDSSPNEETELEQPEDGREVTVAETDTQTETEGADADEYVEPHEKGDGDGEKLHRDRANDAEVEAEAETEGLPELPDDEDEEEEREEGGVIVVETPGPKSIVALTGEPAGDTGKDSDKAPNPFPSSLSHYAEAGPSSSKIRAAESVANGNNEDLINILADNLDPAAHDDDAAAYDEGESYEEEEEVHWEDAVDGDEDPDTTWDAEAEHETTSNESSVTLSSKASKRSFEEVELEEDEAGRSSPLGSPGAKRTRVD